MTLQGAVLLITGGTGSFGNRVARRLAQAGPAEIRILSRDEKKQWDMQRAFPDYRYIVGDVRDAERVRTAMKGVDFVFHAAALKQVPSCENYPVEAMRTNALGSHNVCLAASDAGVKRVVALSTDKAVKPVNAMGISKAMMEKIVCSQNLFADTTTIFSCVRYGNVMGSRGSVIPLFRKQMAEGKPITLTVPNMTRFLLTLDQSVDLVVHALENSRGGEIFVRKAPACTVEALAKCMRLVHSNAEHPIVVTGIRPGEKIDEVLVSEYEATRATDDGEYFTIHPEYRPPATSLEWSPGQEYTSANTNRLESAEEIGALLERVGTVEEYV
jgi:UDP-N-acetylglucosamine 4,6-dehydratase/5-epimerase